MGWTTDLCILIALLEGSLLRSMRRTYASHRYYYRRRPQVLSQGAPGETTPTIGLNVKVVKRGNMVIKAWDLGGQHSCEWGLRNLVDVMCVEVQ